MIGRLRGIIIEKKPPQLLIDVNGVGYEVEAPMSTFYRLPEAGKEVLLHTHFVVREDAQLLYGFFTQQERALFRAVIKVNGVGPRLGLAILSSIEPDSFVQCVMDDDTATLVRVPGIGKKTAERLIIEMRDRLADWQQTDSSGKKVATINLSEQRSAMQEAISALVALGYKPPEASRALARVDSEGVSSEELIRIALKGMAA